MRLDQWLSHPIVVLPTTFAAGGLTFGLVMAVTPEGSSELIAAVTGAIVGGSIAAGIQSLALRDARRARERALGQSLLIKTRNILNGLVSLRRAYKHLPDGKREPWAAFQPLVGMPEPVSF